jgi:multicomponent Na+:H+ antiporter subunit D
MLLSVNIIAFVAIWYSWSYMDHYTSPWKYYTLCMLMLTGLNGVLLTNDLFTFYVFMELTALSSYALVAFGCEHEELEASFKYLIMGTVASLFIFLGIIIVYSIASTLSLNELAALLSQQRGRPSVQFAMVLFLGGFCLKCAVVPFHAWLPYAHPSAPAPVSAMLSGLVIKTLGIYAILRVVYMTVGLPLPAQSVLLFLGTLSMVAGVILAIGQQDLKRLLAYSSISQIGYIILGIGLGTPLGLLGALYHLINHAAFKSLLFLNAGAIEYQTNTRELKALGGLKDRLPVTSATSMIASLSISGIPPFNGFWSKLILVVAAVQAGLAWYAGSAVLVSLATLALFLRVQRAVFLGALKEEFSRIIDAPFAMRMSMIFLAVICIGLMFLLLPPVKTALFDPAISLIIRNPAT